jgi:acid phosphatase type 7
VASRSYIVALGLAGVVVVATAGVAVAHQRALNDWPYASHTGQATTYTLATVGDIACEPDDAENAGPPAALKCGSATLGGMPAEYATAQQADAMHPDLVALRLLHHGRWPARPGNPMAGQGSGR